MNAAGFALIRHWEGLRLEAYQCAAHKWTIGFGHTEGVRPGMRITAEEAEGLLRRDVAYFEHGVRALVTVPLTENQLAALVSLAFNIGLGAFAGSVTLRRLNAGALEGAADAFLNWRIVDHKVDRGLVKRRAAERELFLTPDEAKETV